MPEFADNESQNEQAAFLDNRIRSLMKDLNSPDTQRSYLPPEVSAKRDWVAIIGLCISVLISLVGAYVWVRVTLAENTLNIVGIQNDATKTIIANDKQFLDTNSKIIRHEVVMDKIIADLKAEIDKKNVSVQTLLDKLNDELRTNTNAVILQNERIDNLRREK